MLYLSALFKERYPKIFRDLTSHISIKEIPNTKDIWIRDFILFNYLPQYLNNIKYQPL